MSLFIGRIVMWVLSDGKQICICQALCQAEEYRSLLVHWHEIKKITSDEHKMELNSGGGLHDMAGHKRFGIFFGIQDLNPNF